MQVTVLRLRQKIGYGRGAIKLKIKWKKHAIYFLNREIKFNDLQALFIYKTSRVQIIEKKKMFDSEQNMKRA